MFYLMNVWQKGFIYLSIHGEKVVRLVKRGRGGGVGRLRGVTAFNVRILWHRLWVVQNYALTFHELLLSVNDNKTQTERFPTHCAKQSWRTERYLCEIITVNDVILEPVYFQVYAQVEVFPLVKISTLVLCQTLALEPLPLYKPGVLHSGLDNAHAVIFKVVVNDHGAHTILLFRRIKHILRKIRKKTEQLQDTQEIRSKNTSG